ncbi:hypothetical protein L596_021282 [Steinernema carpocapsae]|uniref:Uncharacterized protein n=1 Tax=Steinernema carpocapsae TaxID=34508 RepID=A0A4U5MIL4_STECR|nr:hypothetical protein L596_021282 [Steinernema carpocapsae]
MVVDSGTFCLRHYFVAESKRLGHEVHAIIQRKYQIFCDYTLSNTAYLDSKTALGNINISDSNDLNVIFIVHGWSPDSDQLSRDAWPHVMREELLTKKTFVI